MALIIRECHEYVIHNGVKETLEQTRSKYWIIYSCTTGDTQMCNLPMV